MRVAVRRRDRHRIKGVVYPKTEAVPEPNQVRRLESVCHPIPCSLISKGVGAPVAVPDSNSY